MRSKSLRQAAHREQRVCNQLNTPSTRLCPDYRREERLELRPRRRPYKEKNPLVGGRSFMMGDKNSLNTFRTFLLASSIAIHAFGFYYGQLEILNRDPRVTLRRMRDQQC